MIVDIISNKNINQVVNELLFIRGRKPNICTVFQTQSFYAVPKDVRLNCVNFFYWKLKANKSFSKSHLIIYQILTLKTLWIFTKNVLQNHTSFQWMIVLLHQKNLYFKHYFLEKTWQLMIRLEMKKCNMILSTGKIDTYELIIIK